MNKYDDMDGEYGYGFNEVDAGYSHTPFPRRPRCMDNRMAAKVNKFKRKLLKDLEAIGIYEDNHARTGSVYLKFHQQGMGSLRISDHAGRSKYRFRWNLDMSRTGRTVIDDDGVDRVFFGPDAYNQLLAELRRLHMLLKENMSDDYDLWNED
ncbi:hypothetical protein [Aeromonas phage BUCT552]|nr:hypothetical protein [Aeromonas phage BUCT552]